MSLRRSGDYVLLRQGGLSNKQALLFNLLSATGSLVGVVVVVGIGSSALDLISYFLAFGAVRCAPRCTALLSSLDMPTAVARPSCCYSVSVRY